MCHQSCEDLLTEQCTGPKRSPTDCDDGTSERVGGSKSKHRHDAVSVREISDNIDLLSHHYFSIVTSV